MGKWIQVASRNNLSDAMSFANDLYRQHGRQVGHVYVFTSTNRPDWYAIALWPFPRALAGNIMQQMSSSIPWDSMVVTGRHYGSLVNPDNAGPAAGERTAFTSWRRCRDRREVRARICWAGEVNYRRRSATDSVEADLARVTARADIAVGAPGVRRGLRALVNLSIWGSTPIGMATHS
jgi:hypothetical protein